MIRVLVVEDSPTVRQTLVNILETAPDIRVVGQADNGRDAIRLTARLQPDLITMDVVMPEMDGLAATREIMRLQPTRILIVTAHEKSAELNVAFEAMQAGALDVFAKPRLATAETEKWAQAFILKIKELAALDVQWDRV